MRESYLFLGLQWYQNQREDHFAEYIVACIPTERENGKRKTENGKRETENGS